MGKALKQRDGFLRYMKRTGAPIVAPSNGTGAKNALFGAICVYKRSFCQERQTQEKLRKRETRFSFLGSHEDPFFWRDQRGRYHAVTHNQAQGNLCGNRSLGSTCGAHLFSRDSYLLQ